jgi:hypothetical protein
VVLDALAARALDLAEARSELLDQRRLADTRLARNPDNRALAVARDVPRAVQP